MSVIDFKASQKWAKLPQKMKQAILGNVFCSSCGVTSIVEYTLHNDKLGILIKGKCVKCGNNVVRLVEEQ